MEKRSICSVNTVYLHGKYGISSEKGPFSDVLPKLHRSATEAPRIRQAMPAEGFFAYPCEKNGDHFNFNGKDKRKQVKPDND